MLNMKRYLQQVKKNGLDNKQAACEFGRGGHLGEHQGEGRFYFCFLVPASNKALGSTPMSMSSDWRVLSLIPSSCSADSSLCMCVNTYCSQWAYGTLWGCHCRWCMNMCLCPGVVAMFFCVCVRFVNWQMSSWKLSWKVSFDAFFFFLGMTRLWCTMLTLHKMKPCMHG